MQDKVQSEIERLTRQRHEIWSGARGAAPGEIEHIGAKLAELYETKRSAGAQSRGRDAIIRRARVESELERLTTAR